jgi:hypothetical protein
MEITTAARRIVREANSWIGTGQSGWLVFDRRDGTGGAWYSQEVSLSALERGPNVVVVAVPQTRRDRLGYAAMQAYLDGDQGWEG